MTTPSTVPPTSPPPPERFWLVFPAPVPESGTSLTQHKATLVLTVLAGAAVFLPPRRLDLRTSLLGSGAVYGVSQLRYDWTGKTFRERTFGPKAEGEWDPLGIPDKAKATQQRIRWEKEQIRLRKEREERKTLGLSEGAAGVRGGAQGAEGDNEAKEERENKNMSWAQRVWMGNEKDDWKERRQREHREALEKGEGLWDLMTKDIGEAWNQVTGRSKSKEDKKDDVNNKPSSSSPSSL